MGAENIIQSWKKELFKPVYLLHGEEEFYIDQLVSYAEDHLLKEDQKSFNLTIFYGKDTDWNTVVNACRRYPMFAERQVVILKEAQLMNGLDKLEIYIEKPLSSTIFIIAYRGKKFDKRTRLFQLMNKTAEVFESAKIPDHQIGGWIGNLVNSRGFAISHKSVALLQEHIGNDLSRISSELEKLIINLSAQKNIDESAIEKYIGISKEYNAFELQAAISNKDLPTAMKIINYFDSNPKAGPIQLVSAALYSFFSRVYSVYGLQNSNEATLKPIFYFNPQAVKQAQITMKNYGYQGVERIILLLHHYNLKSIGIGNAGNTGDAALLKEMVAKMIL
jgi:DNA polymerase-3 subunit delta